MSGRRWVRTLYSDALHGKHIIPSCEGCKHYVKHYETGRLGENAVREEEALCRRFKYRPAAFCREEEDFCGTHANKFRSSRDGKWTDYLVFAFPMGMMMALSTVFSKSENISFTQHPCRGV